MPSDYKPFIEILPEKADSWRNYCICIACRDVNGRPNTLLKKFPNKTERVKNHLKKCLNFKNKYPEMFDEFFGSEIARTGNEFDENMNSNKRVRRESASSGYLGFSSILQGSMYFFIKLSVHINYNIKKLYLFF